MIEQPQFEEPIRIISDLHFGHPASMIEQPRQLIPLFRDVKTVIFNGDSVELRYLRGRRIGMRNSVLLREACEGAGARPVFINGNHDPILSDLSHVDLVDGAVLVTHGDLLFHDISPWSHEAGVLGEAHSRELAGIEEDAFLDFETRLKASKRAALAIELHRSGERRAPFSVMRTVLRECWPPWRPLQIVHSWAITRRGPRRWHVFSGRGRGSFSSATLIFRVTWQRGPRMIINTGSFLPFGGRMAVDIQGETLKVCPILTDRALFQAGAPMMEFAATKLVPGEGY